MDTNSTLRRANALSVFFEERECILFNYITQDLRKCSFEALKFLSEIQGAVKFKTILEIFPDATIDSISEALSSLIEASAILIVGSEVEVKDSQYKDKWEWGPVSGLYHFGTKDGKYLTVDQAITAQEERAAVDPSPPLWDDNSSYKDVLSLEWPEMEGQPLRLMRSRRTHRDLVKKFITEKQLSECLFSGAGMTGIGKNSKIGDIPFTITPSGGARNPYELYVYVQKVEGIEVGIYKYSGLKHNLALVNSDNLPLPSELLGDQEWANDAAAIIFAVARFERTMWKYTDAGAYSVVLIEAGFIGQNIALSATNNGLVANPTSAIHDSVLEKAFKIDSPTHGAVLAMIIGTPNLETLPVTVSTDIRDGK